MPGALRPSLDLSQKSNVIPSINRRTEATAEDFKELSDIANNHANILDELTQAENRNLFYGIFESKELLEAAFENVQEDGIAIIDPQVGQQIIAKYKNGAWTYQEVTAPIQFYPTKLDRPANGETGIWYIVLDEKKAYLWVGGWLGIGTDGQNGISAYQVAVAFGFQGTENEWLASLIGDSAFQIAVNNGFEGTEAEWVASLGGIPGKSAYEVAQDEGFQGTVQEWLDSLVGAPGAPGQDGDSAYQIWLDQGNAGTEADFLEWLKGDPGNPGKSAYQTWLDNGNVGTEADFLEWLKGDPGAPGEVTAQQLADAKQEAIDSANAYTDLQVASSNAWQNRYTDIAALLAGQNNQSIDKFQFVLNASADATVDSGWAVYELKDNATKTANLSDYRKLSEQESMDVAASGESVDTSNLAKLDANNLFVNALNRFGAELLIGREYYSGTWDSGLSISRTDYNNPSKYAILAKSKRTPSGWKTILNFQTSFGENIETAFQIDRQQTNGIVRFFVQTDFNGVVNFNSPITPPGIVINGRAGNNIMSWPEFGNSAGGQITGSSATNDTTAGGNPTRYVDYKVFSSLATSNWLGVMRWFVQNGNDGGTEVKAMQVYALPGQNEAVLKVFGTVTFNKLDLTNLIEATDDADASSKGVPIGYAYVNSTTGAVHKRRS